MTTLPGSEFSSRVADVIDATIGVRVDEAKARALVSGLVDLIMTEAISGTSVRIPRLGVFVPHLVKERWMWNVNSGKRSKTKKRTKIKFTVARSADDILKKHAAKK